MPYSPERNGVGDVDIALCGVGASRVSSRRADRPPSLRHPEYLSHHEIVTRDWLVDDDRADRARERLLGEAAAMIRQNGVDRFDINELARRAHCSRATVYRHVGGKDAIIEAVLTISSATVTTAVAERIAGLSGRERGVVAIAAALREIRADTLTRQLLTSRRLQSAVPAAVASPTIIGIAIELMGLESGDVVSAQWLIRGFLALALWPLPPDHEATAVRALVAGVIGEG